MRSLRFVALALPLVLAAFACTSDPDPGPVSPAGDGGASGDGSVVGPGPDAEVKDGGADARAESGVTAVTTTIKGVTRPLDRAQFGDEKDDAGVQRFHVEAHFGGDPACPNEKSPAPERTLIVSGLRRGAPGTKQTKADGVTSAFLDFTNEQLQDPPVTKATAVTVTITAIDESQTPAFVEFDVEATFAEGTATGHVRAEYCASMSL